MKQFTETITRISGVRLKTIPKRDYVRTVVATAVVVGTVTAGTSGRVVGTFTSLAAVTVTESDAGVEPLLLTATDSSSIGVYTTIIRKNAYT